MEKIQTKPWLKIVGFSLLGLLLVTGLVWAGYWYGKNSKLKSQILTPTIPPMVTSQPTFPPEPTLSPNETAGWKTYTNTKYGYSIKYPTGPEFQQIECNEEEINVFIFNIKGDSSYQEANCGARDAYFSVEVHAATGSFSKEEYPPEGDYPRDNPFLRGTSEKVVIGGVEGKKYTLLRIAPAPVPAKEYEFLLQKGRVKFRIIFIAFAHEDIFNLILSTFKFLD